MVSEASTTTPTSSDQEADKSANSKSKPKKVAFKKVHKSEREKLKRDQLNILFLQLTKCLDSVHQNHGKASTLTEATKLVGDLLSQIECLKKENTSLLSESQYLITEKNELKEETATLKDGIMEVQNKIREEIQSQQAKTYRGEEGGIVFASSNHVIRRPHARYPSPWDTWPSQILDNPTHIVGGARN